MAQSCVLAIDQGTSNTKAVLVDISGTIIAKSAAALRSTYPQPGWAEQSADAIWQSVRKVIGDIVARSGGVTIIGLAIANQRESLVVWDAQSGEAIAPCILWQCRRTAAECAALHASGRNELVESRTGLAINPLFPASKLGWVMAEVPLAGELLRQGRLRAGTVDTWLLWKLTDGKSFATDHSNASRTQLFNTETLQWDDQLCDLFAAPRDALADVRASNSCFGHTGDATALAAGIPVQAMMGDSHAALFGHGVRQPGLVKATYGTGSSLMALTPARIRSGNGLSGTIAWSTAAGVAFAIEGNITVSTQAAVFVSTLLGLSDVGELAKLALTVQDSGGITFVPALAGLGAPHWNDRAKGAIDGLTLASSPAHLARATFEAIVLQIADVFSAMESDVGQRLDGLMCDGGGSANNFLMQLQADVLNRDVTRGALAEVGALGVARMAFQGLGIAMGNDPDTSEVQIFRPGMPTEQRIALQDAWRLAIAKALAT